ncbi:MAG: hypothetical protein JWM12_1163 [Ilumatobacteraceae bacterium]|nr:hypothetical protein [Ilumatobacteraceae bacterium]
MDERIALDGRILHPAGDGVVYGPGSTAQHLAGLIARMGRTRPFLVTTGSVVRAGLDAEVVAALGVEPVGVFDGSVEHTPAPVVLAATAAARDADADCLVSLGGSSVVDLTKGVALVLAAGDEVLQRRVDRSLLDRPKLPHVSLPTTLSGAEFTGVAGITDPTSSVKRAYMHPTLAPRWVVLDPLLARATPAALWSATGMKVLADTIEVLCSRLATPMSDAVALGALAILDEHLVTSTSDPENLVARGWSQFAVAMVLPQLVGVGLGLVAALRHQLGGGLGVPHGVASTIVLPHVLRWNAADAARPLRRAAAVMGLGDGDAVVARLESLTDQLGLPRRLRDVGVRREDFSRVAEHVLHDAALSTNPRDVPDVDAVVEVLDAAF